MKYLNFVKSCLVSAVLLNVGKSEKHTKDDDDPTSFNVTVTKVTEQRFHFLVTSTSKRTKREPEIDIDLAQRKVTYSIKQFRERLLRNKPELLLFKLCFYISVQGLVFADELFYLLHFPTVSLKLPSAYSVYDVFLQYPDVTVNYIFKQVLVTSSEKVMYNLAVQYENPLPLTLREKIIEKLGEKEFKDALTGKGLDDRVSLKTMMSKFEPTTPIMIAVAGAFNDVEAPELVVEKSFSLYDPCLFSLLNKGIMIESALKKSVLAEYKESKYPDEIQDNINEVDAVNKDTAGTKGYHLYWYPNEGEHVPFVFTAKNNTIEGLELSFYCHKNNKVFAVATVYEPEQVIVVTGLLDKPAFEVGFAENQFSPRFQEDMTYDYFFSFVENHVCPNFDCTRVVVVYERNEVVESYTNFNSPDYKLPYQLCVALNREESVLPKHYKVSSANQREMRLKYGAQNVPALMGDAYTNYREFYGVQPDRKKTFQEWMGAWFKETNLKQEQNVMTEEGVEYVEFQKNADCLVEGYNKMEFSPCIMYYDIPCNCFQYGDLYMVKDDDSSPKDEHLYLGVDDMEYHWSVKIKSRWVGGEYVDVPCETWCVVGDMRMNDVLPLDVDKLVEHERFQKAKKAKKDKR